MLQPPRWQIAGSRPSPGGRSVAGYWYSGHVTPARRVCWPRVHPDPGWRSNRLLHAQRRDSAAIVAELAQDLLGMLAEERRARNLRRAVRHLDRIADREILA